MTGTVVRIMSLKRFGFIRGAEDSKDYFFHLEDFRGSFDELVDDFERGIFVKVEFEPVQSVKGLRASAVQRV